MTAALATMTRVADIRLRQAKRIRAEAAEALRHADAAVGIAAARVTAAAARKELANESLREMPGCPQRHFLRAARERSLIEAHEALALARSHAEAASADLASARATEARAEQRGTLIGGRLATWMRRRGERTAEREGEDRWTERRTA